MVATCKKKGKDGMVEDELRRSFKDNEIWKQMKVLAHETAFIRTG